MTEMKYSGVEWIGDIPIQWKTRRIKEFLYERKELCSAKDNYDLLAVSEYYGVAKKADVISDNEFETHAESLEGYKICQPEDLVMNIMLAWKRAMGVSPYTGITSPAYCVFAAKDDVCMRFFHYLFRTDYYASTFKQHSTGIIDSRLRLYPDKFLALSCHFPPLVEQQRIADFLDRKCADIDNVLEKTKASIEEYKKLKQSIITESVTKGIRGERPMKDSGLEWIGNIPFDWDVKRVKSCVESFSKGNGITKDEVFADGDMPCVRYGEIYSKYGNSFSKCVSATKLENQVSPQYFSKGDILCAATGELVEEIGKGIVYIGDTPCLAGGDIIIIQHKQNPIFLNYVLNSSYAQAQKSCQKTKLKVVHISASDIGDIHIALPTIDEQNQIALFLDQKCSEIDSLIESKELFIKDLEAYRKSLIYEYVTGKKEVL